VAAFLGIFMCRTISYLLLLEEQKASKEAEKMQIKGTKKGNSRHSSEVIASPSTLLCYLSPSPRSPESQQSRRQFNNRGCNHLVPTAATYHFPVWLLEQTLIGHGLVKMEQDKWPEIDLYNVLV